jgi:alpha-D-xyloside xylohydrolase
VKKPLQKCLATFGALLVAASLSASAAPVLAQMKGDDVLLPTPSGTLRLQVWSDRIIRVTSAPGNKLPEKKSFSVIARPAKAQWDLSQTPDTVFLNTAALHVQVNKTTGVVGFFDLHGKPILLEAENGRKFSPTTETNLNETSVRQKFILPADERIYGLGQHQSGVWNYRGTTVHLQQRNMEVGLPVLVSSRGYGVLWDNPAVTDVDVGKTDGNVLSWNSEAGGAVDYYFMSGPSADDVIRDYRELTGAAPMMPEWLWGFWQCKERYQTQAEMTNIVAEYRKLGVPLDGIIQDWQYWTNGGWGSHAFDPARYANPAEMVKDLHAMHAHVLISIWPKFDLGTENSMAMEKAGALYPPVLPSVYPKGRQKWYDPFNANGRKTYWSLVSKDLFSLGFDGWWLDASEGEFSGKWGEFREFQTAAGLGAEVFNAYPLLHTTGLAQGQRAQTDAKRVVILTRSAYAGQQRNSAITWSGDIRGSWAVFARQIPAGLNFSVSGIPYWNTDIGGFTGGNPTNKNYQELFTRWFQFGAFNPMFRVHGTGAGKEFWRWDEPTQKILADYIKLRYRLLPYIYSASWQVTSAGGTMLRPLMMDFGGDTNALDIGDQFLFGPEIMVSPVTEAHAATRSVYLPGSGGWYDFWTGKRIAGGQRIETASPIETLPLFVRAGGILPLGPVVQYVSEKPAEPVELRVYRGADGAFTLYEDQGNNFGYEKGAFATIPLTWNEAAGTLTIGARNGKFPGMLKERTFRVVFVNENHGTGGAETPDADAIVKYAGKAVAVQAGQSPK